MTNDRKKKKRGDIKTSGGKRKFHTMLETILLFIKTMSLGIWFFHTHNAINPL